MALVSEVRDFVVLGSVVTGSVALGSDVLGSVVMGPVVLGFMVEVRTGRSLICPGIQAPACTVGLHKSRLFGMSV